MTGWEISPFRELATGQLLRERECRQWDLLDVDAHPEGWQFAEESRAFLAFTIGELDKELERRRRLRDRPGAPRWPDERSQKDELEEIKRRVTLVEFIHRETAVHVFERRGPTDVWCCCPLPDHIEDTPSFHIDEERRVWHCFGCGRGGALFELARHVWSEGLFFRVVDRLANLAGIERAKPPVPVPKIGRERSPVRIQ
jgi:hypothetical protein